MKRRLLILIELAGLVVVLPLLATFLLVCIYKFVPVTDTCFMHTMAKKSGATSITQHWVPLSQMSAELPLAVVSSEDNLFLKHNGVSWDAIELAHANNQKGKRLRGGSTISQQTAKNVFLWNDRSYIRKGLELIITYMIEGVWGKRRIMEVYLNVIEQGPGVYGVEASAQTYFHHSAKAVTRQEAARMAAVLPNPIRFKVSKPSAYVLKRQGQIASLMPKMGRLNFDE